jgi:hypothetical protein
MVEEAGVECTLFVIYKAGREHTPYWWWVVVLPNNWYKPKALSHPGLEWLCVFIMDLNLILVYDSGAEPGRAHPTCAPPPLPPPKIAKNVIFWRKFVTFHTKYTKYFRASLRSAQFFYVHPPNLKSWIRPCECMVLALRIYMGRVFILREYTNRWYFHTEGIYE